MPEAEREDLPISPGEQMEVLLKEVGPSFLDHARKLTTEKVLVEKFSRIYIGIYMNDVVSFLRRQGKDYEDIGGLFGVDDKTIRKWQSGMHPPSGHVFKITMDEIADQYKEEFDSQIPKVTELKLKALMGLVQYVKKQWFNKSESDGQILKVEVLLIIHRLFYDEKDLIRFSNGNKFFDKAITYKHLSNKNNHQILHIMDTWLRPYILVKMLAGSVLCRVDIKLPDPC